jgi:hypothetical protein
MKLRNKGIKSKVLFFIDQSALSLEQQVSDLPAPSAIIKLNSYRIVPFPPFKVTSVELELA